MKVLAFIKNLILGILLTAFFSFVIFNTILLLNINDYGVTQFENTSMVIIKNEISSDKYKKDDVILVKRKNLDKINVGEEIFVYKVQKSGAPEIDLGIIGEVHIEDEAISFENGATYSEKFIIGEADKVYSEVGKYLSIFQSKWGFLFIILVPSFLIFVYELYAIVVEIKYEKDQNETKE